MLQHEKRWCHITQRCSVQQSCLLCFLLLLPRASSARDLLRSRFKMLSSSSAPRLAEYLLNSLSHENSQLINFSQFSSCIVLFYLPFLAQALVVSPLTMQCFRSKIPDRLVLPPLQFSAVPSVVSFITCRSC